MDWADDKYFFIARTPVKTKRAWAMDEALRLRALGKLVIDRTRRTAKARHPIMQALKQLTAMCLGIHLMSGSGLITDETVADVARPFKTVRTAPM